MLLALPGFVTLLSRAAAASDLRVTLHLLADVRCCRGTGCVPLHLKLPTICGQYVDNSAGGWGACGCFWGHPAPQVWNLALRLSPPTARRRAVTAALTVDVCARNLH